MDIAANLSTPGVSPGLRSRLTNWARWAWSPKTVANGHCRSIEHKYQAPRCWDEPQARIVVDALDAYVVESAWRELPEQEKTALKHEHVMGWRKMVDTHRMGEGEYLARHSRKLGIRRADVPAFIHGAEMTLRDALRAAGSRFT